MTKLEIDFLIKTVLSIPSVMRQNDDSQSDGYRKTKHAKFFEKRKPSHFLIRTRTCYAQGKRCSFFGKFRLHCFLATNTLRYALLSSYWRF